MGDLDLHLQGHLSVCRGVMLRSCHAVLSMFSESADYMSNLLLNIFVLLLLC